MAKHDGWIPRWLWRAYIYSDAQVNNSSRWSEENEMELVIILPVIIEKVVALNRLPMFSV